MPNLRENMSFSAVTDAPSSSWWKIGANTGVTGKIALALVVSVACGGYAASLTNTWFEDELTRYKLSIKTETVAPAPAMQKIIVASKSVRHGEELTPDNTKIINWAADELPASAFKATSALFTKDGKRFALASLEANEPVLSSKITEPGKSASLSAQLSPGKKAVTIRVDDVLGVGGLIVPNDRVDILWTTKPDREAKNNEPFTEMLIPNVRVLALDQSVKENSGNTHVARAITIEVDIRQAQKVTLGSQTGKLHLALRGHGSENKQNFASFQRVSLSNLGTSNALFQGFETVPVSSKAIKFDPRDVTASITPSTQKPARQKIKIIITRGTKSEEYDVFSSS